MPVFSATRRRSRARAATCCSSSTTFTATRWLARKCPRCSVVCRPQWVTSRRWRKMVLEDRITSTKTGSITSVQAVYVPADDLTIRAGDDVRPPRHHRRVSRRIASSASIGGDPLDSTSRQLDRRSSVTSTMSRARRTGGAPALQGAAGRHRDPGHGRVVGGGQAHRRTRAQDPALPVAAVQRRGGGHRPAASSCR